MSIRSDIVATAIDAAAVTGNFRRLGRALAAMILCAAFAGLFAANGRAADPSAIATQLSDGAFAMLKSLNAQNSGGSSSPMLGPVASFAGDAQTLSHALTNGDRAAASNALGQLQSDRSTVDAALGAHPGALNATDWGKLKGQLDALAKQILTSASGSGSIGTAGTITHESSAPPPESGTAGASASVGAAPKVVIDSRTFNGSDVRLKGYFEGTALKTAGIYQGRRRVRAFKVNDVLGEQRVEFDIGLQNPTPDAAIRIVDVDGRVGEASVLDPTMSASDSLASARPSEPSGVEVLRDSRSGAPETASTETPGGESPGGNTAEIPSHGPVSPSPSKRHTHGGKLGNVQIQIISSAQINTMPPTYEVVGQIHGRGITHAGIYVDDRLVKTIPIADGANSTSFDQRFLMNGGAASIRAYGVGDQYVESSLDLGASTGIAMAPMTRAPMMGVPMQYPGSAVVQITSVRQIAPSLDVVTGVISGSNITAAGLYQNGMLVQNLALSKGIAGSLLGALIPEITRNVNFSARFNPNAGQAVVRVFDSSGAYTDQPVMVAGMNPYGGYGMNPYGGYGANPYGGYGANPYGGYGGATSPFAPRPPATSPGISPPFGGSW
jgi:hypothetical protein